MLLTSNGNVFVQYAVVGSMVKDTRSSVRARNEENNNLKGKQNGEKAPTRAGSTTPDSALRRSARDTSLRRKIVVTPSKSRKSDRLDKQSASTRDKKKHGTLENKNVLNPLRRSERGKKQSSSTSSGSGSKKLDKSSSTSSGSVSKKSDKSSGSPNTKGKKEKKEKSIEQLALEPREAGKSPKQDKLSKNAKSNRMDARAYRALFREKLKTANSSGILIVFSLFMHFFLHGHPHLILPVLFCFRGQWFSYYHLID